MGRLFGKDGIRGVAVTELTCELAMQVGRALAAVYARPGETRMKILIGKDTRSSADTIEAALSAGICSAGADAELLGVVPAPAVAYLIKERKAACGVMVMVSNRSSEFCGLKVFSGSGHRMGHDNEDAIERLVLDTPAELMPVPRRRYGSVTHYDSAIDDYVYHVKSCTEANLSGMRLALDCANGSCCMTARQIFTELGAEIVLMGNRPDGYNINRDCGSTCIDPLMDFVRTNECDCGLAFDGGGERCLAVDENGRLIDGDEIIAVCARYMKEKEKLGNNTIVTSTSNNLGLMQFARTNDIYTVTAAANERSMLRKMLEGGFSIGGDPGGHILFPDDAPSADGQLTGVHLLEVLRSTGKPMSELTGGVVRKVPQVMLNVRISPRDREIWKNDRMITSLIDEYEGMLGDDGRIIVREIGKESLIRIMVEGEDFSTINSMAVRIADTIKERCGGI